MHLVEPVLGGGEDVGHYCHPLSGVTKLHNVAVKINRAGLLLLERL